MDYTAEDEVIIKEKWDDLLLSCTKICKNDEDWNFIKRAFFLAKEAHQGVRRRSGEPYLLHPIAVAKIVIEEIGLGVKSALGVSAATESMTMMSMALERISESAISNACSPLSGCEISRLSTSTPNFWA